MQVWFDEETLKTSKTFKLNNNSYNIIMLMQFIFPIVNYNL